MTCAEFQSAICLTNMPLPLQLLGIVLRIRKERRHMEHDLPVAKCLVQRVDARLAKLRVQTPTVPNHKRINNKNTVSTDEKKILKQKKKPLEHFFLNLLEADEYAHRFVYKLQGMSKKANGMMMVAVTPLL